MKNVKTFSKRALTLLLAVAMCVSLLNLTAFAETEDSTTDKYSYVLNFNPNGGSGSFEPQKATTAESTHTFKVDTPTRDGYTFDGWHVVIGAGSYDPDTQTVTMYNNTAGTTVDMLLKALWKCDGHHVDENPKDGTCDKEGCNEFVKYTVSYSWTGEASESTELPAPQDYTVGETVTVHSGYTTDTDEAGNTYTFSGWTVEGEVTFNDDGTFNMPARNVTITGKWTKTEHTHSWDDVEKKDATCTEPGHEAGKTCSVCGATDGLETIEAGHTWKAEWSKDKDHHWYVCSVCGEKKDFALHDWGNGEVTKAATCTEKGVMTYTCKCGASYTEDIDIDPTSHKWVDVEQQNATCTEDGHEAGQECSVCGATNYKIIKADHQWKEVAEVAATCTEAGHNAGKRCEVCNATEGLETIDALGHAFGAWQNDEEQGDHYRKCTRDGYVERAAHSYGEWIVRTEATVEAAGEEYRICEVCGHQDIHEIEQLIDVDIPEEDPPLSDLPELDIPDSDVPLASVPDTGDYSHIWAIVALVSGMGLAVLALTNKKREEIAE